MVTDGCSAKTPISKSFASEVVTAPADGVAVFVKLAAAETSREELAASPETSKNSTHELSGVPAKLTLTVVFPPATFSAY